MKAPALPRLVRRVVPDPVVLAIRARLARLRPPVISVIVPMYNVERYVGACLASVLSQSFAAFEVIVVDDGSTDRSASIVRSVARRDRRVKLLEQENQGQGLARNHAVSRARGQFLVFVDADDVVPPGAFRVLVEALRRSGSDFAVGGVRRLDGETSFRPSWTVVVHEHDRVGTTIEEFPAAMADVVAHHRIFRRRFWIDRVGGFGPGVYEDHVPMVAAYLRARQFDLLSRVVYEWRLRAEGTSTGQQKHDLGNLQTRIAVKAQGRELVWREATPPVRAAWVGRVLDIDFPPYVEHALRADETYRRTLQDALATYIDLATADALAYVRVRQKVRTHLAALGAWDALRDVEAVFEELGSIPPTTVRDGAVYVARSAFETVSIDLPDHVLELSRSESRLQVCLATCDAPPEGRMSLTGWAVIRAVDLSTRTPAIRLSLVHESGEPSLDVPFDAVELPAASAWVRWPHGSFDRAGFRADVDLHELASAGDIGHSWRLRARVEVGGLVREGGVHHALAGSSASQAALRHCRATAGSVTVYPTYHPEHGFTLTLRRSLRGVLNR